MAKPTTTRRDKRESRKLSFTLYRLFYGPAAFIRLGYRQLLILLGMFIFGTILYAYYDGLSALIALFASVSTVTIIGLYQPNNGNFTTMKSGEAILVMVLILVSITSGASLFQSAVSMASSERGKVDAKNRLIKKLKNHIIVYGYSHMGKYITERLEELGYDFVIITRVPDAYNELLRKDLFVVLETETDIVGALNRAGIANASLVIVADVNDSDNLRFILTARKLRPDIKIHTVVHDSTMTDMAKDAGANVVIPSSATVGELLAFSADNKDLVGVVFTQNMKTKGINEFTVHMPSPIIGKKLREIAEKANILGVVRDGKVDPKLFDGSFTVQDGDILLVLGDPTYIKEHLEQRTSKRSAQ